MDYQRQAAFAGSLDVGHESISLPVRRIRLVKVIQPGFTDSDNLVALREFAKLVDTGFLHILVVGVNTGATKYVLVSTNALVHRIKRFKVDPDAKHAGNCLLLDGL